MHWTETRGSYVVFACGKSPIGQRFCWGCELDWGEERLTRGFIVFSGEWKAVGLLRTNCWSNVGKRALTEEAVLSGDIFCWGGRDEVRGWKRGLAKLTLHQCWNNENPPPLACGTLDPPCQVWFLPILGVTILPDSRCLNLHYHVWVQIPQGGLCHTSRFLLAFFGLTVNVTWCSRFPECGREVQREFFGLFIASPAITMSDRHGVLMLHGLAGLRQIFSC